MFLSFFSGDIIETEQCVAEGPIAKKGNAKSHKTEKKILTYRGGCWAGEELEVAEGRQLLVWWLAGQHGIEWNRHSRVNWFMLVRLAECAETEWHDKITPYLVFKK